MAKLRRAAMMKGLVGRNRTTGRVLFEGGVDSVRFEEVRRLAPRCRSDPWWTRNLGTRDHTWYRKDGIRPMGFYVRKSLKAGPFRFNLSKSGVGVSAGVPGFRVGSGPRGNYVHVGAHGVYYRASLGARAGGGAAKRPGRARAGLVARGERQPAGRDA